MLVFLAIPLLVSGIGWVGWRLIQSRMVQCEVCGVSSLKSSSQCPLCGADFPIENQRSSSKGNSEPASSATVDIVAEDAGLDD